jgi:hypothetical protein
MHRLASTTGGGPVYESSSGKQGDQRTSAPSAPSTGTGAVGHTAASRVQAGQFNDAVQSIGANRRCPLHRKATPDLDELGREEPMKPVDTLRIEIHMRSTALHGYSVRDRSTIWRKLNRSAAAWAQPRRFRISYRVDTASPPMGVLFFDYKTGGNAVLSSRR